MPKFTEAYAHEVVFLLFEDKGISKETINKAFKTLGEALIDNDNEGRNKEAIRIMHSINMTIGKLNWLIGLITSIRADPNNNPDQKRVMLVDAENIKTILRASLETIDFLIENYSILCEEFTKQYSPKNLKETRSTISDKLKEAYQGSIGFFPRTLIYIRYFNFRAYKGLAGPEIAQRYIDWMNEISRVIMYYIHEHNTKQGIRTNWMN